MHRYEPAIFWARPKTIVVDDTVDGFDSDVELGLDPDRRLEVRVVDLGTVDCVVFWMMFWIAVDEELPEAD